MQDYDVWNKVKKLTNSQNRPDFYINCREIWFVRMGVNIGFEENGKTDFLRPVLVLKKVGSLFFTVALTSQGKEDNAFYYHLLSAKFNDRNRKHKERSYVILSQVKVMDKRRFTEKMGRLSHSEFETVKQKLKTLLF